MSTELPSHMDVVAMRKAGIEGWSPFKYQLIGDDSVITGGIPRIITRGPRKGRKTWDGEGTSVVVTRAEVEAEAQRFASETGKCSRCYGKGEVFHSWHHKEGTTYRQCSSCAGTGVVERVQS